MPTYAILGATGSTGSELVKFLLTKPKIHLNLYARSASKLAKLHPAAVSSENVTIFTGDLSDGSLLASCLRSVDVIFQTVATNENEPGCSIALMAAHGVVSALELLKREEGPASFKCPTVVVLSSAVVNPSMAAKAPHLLHWVLEKSLCYIYSDLREATEYLQANHQIRLILAQPGAILQGAPLGFELSEEEPSAFISYSDLARAMVQMAEEDGGQKWVGKGVAPVGLRLNERQKNFTPLIWYNLRGLLAVYFPSVWWFLRNRGWW
ncbi:hypothetical protein MMC11_001412 [Xylographa trunciseda]|nr:hypothetical protein [Xylographa trunciseda]